MTKEAIADALEMSKQAMDLLYKRKDESGGETVEAINNTTIDNIVAGTYTAQ